MTGKKPPLQKLDRIGGVDLYVLRLDLVHADFGGNKWYKLKYNLSEMEKRKQHTLVTFGGAFSNHIAATAAAGKEKGIRTIGIIRGEEVSNPTLLFAKEQGMQLHFVSREFYRDKIKLINYTKEQFPDAYIIPEGGANTMGVAGCKEILADLELDADVICCACGTGTTLAGIILSLTGHQKAIGFQVLKAENYIAGEIEKWLTHFMSSHKNLEVIEDYHFGGYAKITDELMKFIGVFEKKYSVPLEPVYTGKLMYGIFDLLDKGYFKPGQKILVIHTGGLQGNQGFRN
ncbi:MAG: 1-aminocyclopropane-1-carboxylate deaminase/D-cysteine desulfhydrase [Bacteroidia bacterium]|jgi:1-aminocyclopropane-1-carboxylate deaminase